MLIMKLPYLELASTTEGLIQRMGIMYDLP